jgi:hypothetical protein
MGNNNKEVASIVISLNRILAKKWTLKILASLTLMTVIASLSLTAKAYEFSPEYETYVHTFLNSSGMGNWTYIEKPVFPVILNTSQVRIGENWSIVCPLEANRSYHVYCYGEWANNGSEPKTDYDMYMYNPLGEMEGYHTESAGLPEHLGTTVDDAFFAPKLSGNYTFVINNDPRESKGDQQATFMIIENVECNVWHEHYSEGKDSNDMPVSRTSWAYEFVTESQRFEVWVKVPETLDMYEARIYLMADPKLANETVLNDVPLAWEPGLYGNRTKDLYGGYNLESKEYRGLAYASCEYFGQDMFLNFTSPHVGKSLYHVVFIGETGSGTIEFLLKTQFKNACLVSSDVPTRVHPQEDTSVTYNSNSTDLENATLQYSKDNWSTNTTLPMEIWNNRTCTGTIPPQAAGTVIFYSVKAKDILENVLTSNGSYSVKNEITLNLSEVRNSITVGENMTVNGTVTPAIQDLLILVQFNCANESKQIPCYSRTDGTFSATFKTENVGTWEAQARFEGDQFTYECSSPRATVEVKEPSVFAQYSVYIGGGLGAIAVVGVIVYWRKMRS